MKCLRCPKILSRKSKHRTCDECRKRHTKHAVASQQKTWQRRKSQGICVDCEAKCVTNPLTGKPFVRCSTCSRKVADYKKAKRAEAGASPRKHRAS